MSGLDFSSIDPVRELRLRQWARQHFVPTQNRRDTWHPIVLDEMACRDLEILDECRKKVEVPPADTVSEERFATEPVPDYNLETNLQSRQWGAMFVPLAPTTHWDLHPATSEIPKPHGRMAGRISTRSLEFSNADTID